MARPLPLRLVRPVALGGAALLVLAAAGCRSTETAGPVSTRSTPTAAAPRADVPVYTGAPGEIAVRPGATFAVALPADPDRGRTWRVTRYDRRIVVPVGSRFEDRRTGSQPVRQLLFFTAAAAGTSEVTLVEIGAADAPVGPSQAWSVVVR